MLTKDELVSQFNEFSTESNILSDFLNNAPNDAIESIDKIGLILLAPENFALGIMEDLLLYLEKKNLIFLDFTIKDQLSDEDLTLLYLPNCKPFVPVFIPNDFRWWLIKQRFTMGPVCAILVGSKDCGTNSIPRLLEGLKGYRVPYKAKVNSIRAKFPSINGILNLVHTSHNSAFVLREGSIFFDLKRIIQSILIARDKGNQGTFSAQYIYNNYLKGYDFHQESSKSFFEVYFRLQHKILNRLTFKEKVNTETVSQLFVLVNDGIRIATENYVKREELFTLAFSIIISQKEIIISNFPSINKKEFLFVNDPVNCLLNSFYTLVSLENAHNVDWIEYIKLLDAFGITVSEWEELVIETTLFNINQEFPEALINKLRQ
ncbi:nucleoside-diphosphate kinase [Bacillus alkalicellulosilyticus]|uniref:nucleoside-diphosphate kinase n=1 Tax=Alkalihalobacterium alkalicellulosilyticum TaxID=1912214 RepID=UPI00099696F5|nr:nucleoside-diphosphate kinase [Bacillus alkalicellulosilyticus]